MWDDPAERDRLASAAAQELRLSITLYDAEGVELTRIGGTCLPRHGSFEAPVEKDGRRLGEIEACLVEPPHGSAWALVIYRRRLDARVTDLRERSAAIGTFLIETLQANRTVVTSGAQSREVGRFSGLNAAFVETVMGLQRVHYLIGGLPFLLLAAGTAAVFFYGGYRVVEGTLTMGTLAAFMSPTNFT